MYKVDSDSILVYSKDDYKTRPVMVTQLLEQLTNDPKIRRSNPATTARTEKMGKEKSLLNKIFISFVQTRNLFRKLISLNESVEMIVPIANSIKHFLPFLANLSPRKEDVMFGPAQRCFK